MIFFFCLSVQSGSFVYDIDLGGHQWNPTKEELMVISAKMHRLAEEEVPFERLVVDQLKAREMFAGNEHKLKQIPDIAKKSPSGTAVTLYRVKDHIDISSGPMMANTSFLGRRCTVAAVMFSYTRCPNKFTRIQQKIAKCCEKRKSLFTF